jgi:hypothetical protein
MRDNRGGIFMSPDLPGAILMGRMVAGILDIGAAAAF